jgi:hypothetical protein
MISLSKAQMLSESELFKLEEELLSAHEKLYNAGREWAKAKDDYEYLEDMKKTVKANAMPDVGPIGTREFDAEKSVNFQKHLKGISLARKTFLLKDVEYQSIKSYIDSLRTIISNRRTLISRGIDSK